MKHERVTLPIYNLGCGGGGALAVERALARDSGVVQAYVNPLTEMAYVVFDPALTTIEQLTRVIDRLGYGAPRVEAVQQQECATPRVNPREGRQYVIAVGLCLSAIYLFCIVADLLFPDSFQTYLIWERLLIGVRWAVPWTLSLGLIEVFLAGALVGWAVVLIRRAGPALAMR
jgi:cation transport ATPase